MHMQRQGITILAAAGDYDNKDLLFPASLETVIAVQSINEKGTLWEECNITMDKKESIVKYPGVDIESLTVENDKLISTISSGTSQSTAIASGYVALIKDYYKKLHKSEIEYDYLLELMKNNTNKSYVKSFDLIKKTIVDKQSNHDTYTKSKTAPTEEEREEARQDYFFC